MFLNKYGVARHIYIAIPKAGSANHAVSGDWTPSAGDVKISKDGGAAANVTNLPVAIAMGNSTVWDFSLTATEMQAAQIVVTVADSATKAVDDTGFIVETYGNASAQHEFDMDTATQPVNVTQFGGSNGTFSGGRPEVNTTHLAGTSQTGRDIGASVLLSSGTGAGQISLSSGLVTLAGVTHTGAVIPTVTTTTTATNLTNAPTNGDFTATMKTSIGTAVAASAVASVTGAVGSVTAGVTVTTNNDKTGYTLSATGSAAMTEGYAALGAAATLPQLLYEMRALLAEKSISGTTLTTKKLDGSTEAATYTLDDATTPSSITRAT